MTKKERIIRKVWLHKATGQKIVTIPKFCMIKEGDYVEVRKIKC